MDSSTGSARGLGAPPNAGLSLETTPIPGLLVLRLPVNADARGWFKENWQRSKMIDVGLPDFGPVQNNVAFNATRGVTRGIHTEPWDKLVSVATGRVFAAWVDMRAGGSFGTSVHLEIDPFTAVFVPRGVGNSYQVLEDATAYTYLVNEHWQSSVHYPALNLADPTVDIPWPIPLEQATISDKDLANPLLDAVQPVPALKTLILGSYGQLGRALSDAYPHATAVDCDQLDLTDPGQVKDWPWGDYELVLNAAAFTAVDAAESDQHRPAAWAANAVAPARLARLAERHRFTLVHYSTDYVFDGRAEAHSEDETPSPLGVYGASKAAGDLAVANAPRHYLIRTSWVVGDGKNFVRTMRALAESGASPTVVNDQFGRLTFTDELARATRHLVDTGAPFGTYNVTNAGAVSSWADLARTVFSRSGRDPHDITDTSTAAWATEKLVSARPRNSVLDLSKIRAAGFEPEDAAVALDRYLAALR